MSGGRAGWVPRPRRGGSWGGRPRSPLLLVVGRENARREGCGLVSRVELEVYVRIAGLGKLDWRNRRGMMLGMLRAFGVRGDLLVVRCMGAIAQVVATQ